MDRPNDSEATRPQLNKPISMHEGVPTWCDTCTCEPEPRWRELGEQLGDAMPPATAGPGPTAQTPPRQE